jgi:uncharacterized protein (DUF2164 family)
MVTIVRDGAGLALSVIGTRQHVDGTMVTMPVTIPPDKLKQLQASVKRYVVENLDAEAGDLKARLLLDCLQEIGAVVYNQAIADAQAYMQGRVADLEAVCYADEFTYWPRK